MQPLTPEDLLIRHNPVDNSRWFASETTDIVDARPAPAVPLERFQALEHVVRDNPLQVDPYLELARIYLQRSRWTDAKRILDQAFQRFPENEEVNYLREEAQIARSLQLVSEATQEHQAEPTRLTEEKLQRCRLELNVLREKVCVARLGRHPEQVELNLPLATALHNLGQSEEAIVCLQTAMQHPRLRAAAALQLGQTLESVKRIPEALAAYRRAALYRVPPPAPEIKLKALAAAANLAQRSHLIDSARRYVQLLLEIQPENAELKTRYEMLCSRPL